MRAEISIKRCDVYTDVGNFDTSLYEIQANLGNDYIQDLQLEHPEDLICLRDALSEYITRNNLTTTENTPEQP